MSGNLYTSARNVVSAVKDIGRLREIVRVLARHGFGELVTRLELTGIGSEGFSIPLTRLFLARHDRLEIKVTPLEAEALYSLKSIVVAYEEEPARSPAGGQ